MESQRAMEDEAKLPTGCRFFKVLIPGFEQALMLPPITCKMLNNGEIPEAAILVSRRGSWRVGVGQCIKGLTFNGEGWNSFIQYHDLSVGDFIVFEHTGNMHFNTLVFDSTTCEKEFPMTSENLKDKGSDDHSHQVVKGINRKQDEATASYRHKNALFQIRLHPYSVKHHHPFLYIPVAFLKSNDLSAKTTVTLINPSGKTWQVHLKLLCKNVNGRSNRGAMTTGWDKFVKANKLKVGDVCVFELNHSPERSNNAVMKVQFLSM